MKLWNKGGEWRRSTGEIIAYAQVFDATEREVRLMTKRRQLGIRFIEVDKVAPPESKRRQAALPAVPQEAQIDTGDAVLLGLTDTNEEFVDDREPEVPVTDETRTDAESPTTNTGDAAPEKVAETPDESGKAPAVEWTLKMSPQLYVKLHPEGPHAEKARQVIAAAGGANGTNE